MDYIRDHGFKVMIGKSLFEFIKVQYLWCAVNGPLVWSLIDWIFVLVPLALPVLWKVGGLSTRPLRVSPGSPCLVLMRLAVAWH